MKIPKSITYAATFLLLVVTVRGQERPMASMTFKVSDDFGKPVKDATVAISTFHHWQPGDNFGKNITEVSIGVTNVEGVATISAPSLRGDFHYGVRQMPGFYPGGGGEYQFAAVEGGKWQPWNPPVDVMIKRIINPIPMYARILGELPSLVEIPAVGTPVGFDLVASDWVAPHGKGTVADFLFKIERRFTSVQEPFEATLTMSFSNKGDGIQSIVAPPFVGSALKLPRYAPENGYAPELVKRMVRPASGAPMESANREGQNYFFRVRTVLDKNEQVVSALYGKIDGDIRFDIFSSKTAGLLFTYYLNPTANDRNMEFDPKGNLFSNLPNLQRPKSP